MQTDVRPDHGFLGIRYVFKNGSAEVKEVQRGTPADQVQLHVGDHVLSLDGAPIRSSSELQDRIYGAMPGSEVSLIVERGGETLHIRPTLAPYPVDMARY
jgi:S1-C subfamily serine protease